MIFQNPNHNEYPDYNHLRKNNKANYNNGEESIFNLGINNNPYGQEDKENFNNSVQNDQNGKLDYIYYLFYFR